MTLHGCPCGLQALTAAAPSPKSGGSLMGWLAWQPREVRGHQGATAEQRPTPSQSQAHIALLGGGLSSRAPLGPLCGSSPEDLVPGRPPGPHFLIKQAVQRGRQNCLWPGG